MSDMFKIVQTIEKGMKQLMIVPSAWEHNDQLRWPKLGADKLVRIANSTPEVNWFSMNCKLKRNHLINYEIAEEELQRMLEHDDTEHEEAPMKKKPRSTLATSKPIELDFNSLMNKCLLPVTVKGNSGVKSSSVSNIDNELIAPQNILGLVPNDQNLSSQIIDKLDKVLANQEIIIANQQKILGQNDKHVVQENQVTIMQQLATLMTTVDTMANYSIGNSCSCKTLSESNEQDIFFDPIETLAGLEKLEVKLGNKTDMEDYVKKLSYVCGRKGSGNGTNNCYILVDKLFTRKFMTLCSWAGGARDGKEKIAFKFFKNVIGLFFRVVRLSDDDFTLKNCEDFFKAVIRNSTKRNESGLARSSRIKRRPKSLSYKTKTTNPQEEEDNALDADNMISEDFITDENQFALEATSDADWLSGNEGE